MTLDELEMTLPNGLHDAALLGVSVNFASKQLVLSVDVDLSDPDAPELQMSAARKPVRLRFNDLQFVMIDPPQEPNAYLTESTITSTGPGQPHTAPVDLPDTDEGVFLCWMFVVNWNGFIRIAARDVTLEWLGESTQVE